MQVKCGQCNAGYTLPAERLVPGRRVQFACRHCGERIVVQVPQEGADHAASSAAAAASSAPERRGPDPLARPLAEPKVEARPDEPRWFVAAPDGSHRKLAESELEAEIRTGAVTGDTLVWRKGLAEWLPAASTDRWQPLLSSLFVAPDAATVDDPALAAAAIAASPSSQRMRRQTDLAFASPLPAGPGPGVADDSYHDSLGGDAETRWGIAAVGDDAAAEPSEQEAAPAASQIAGLSGGDTSQAAVSLPVVRAARLDAPSAQRSRDRLSERRMPSAGHRLAAHRAESGGRAPGHDPRLTQSVNLGPVGGHGARHPLAGGPAMAPAAMAPSGPPPHVRESGGQGRDGAEAGSDGLWAPATDTYVGPRDNFTRRLGSSSERELLLAHVERERNGQRELRRWQIATLGASCVAIIGLAIAGAAMLHARRTQQALAACTAQVPATQHRANADPGTAPGGHAGSDSVAVNDRRHAP